MKFDAKICEPSVVTCFDCCSVAYHFQATFQNWCNLDNLKKAIACFHVSTC